MESRRTAFRQLGGLASSLLFPGLVSATSERYPSQPIKVLVGFPAGGPLDVGTRLVMERVAKAMNTVAVVENKPGASGMLAGQHVAAAPPDGYSLLLGVTANMAISRYLYTKMPYNPDTDLRPAAQFAVSQNVIYARKESGVSTLAQFLDRVRASPGKYNYASPGIGTTPHLTMEMLKATDRLFIVHVPFRGSPQAVNAVVAGDVEFGVDAVSPVIGMAQAGRVVALAQTGERRSTFFPDAPTLRELGLRGFPTGTFLGIFAPAKLADETAHLLEAQVRAAIDEPDVRNRLHGMGLDAAFLDSRQFAASIQSQLPFWKRAVEYSGAKV